jgi:hypothetical protein
VIQMADMQAKLSLGNTDATAKATGLLVVAAVVGLCLLRKLSGSVNLNVGK